jgi:hypothetical protein
MSNDDTLAARAARHRPVLYQSDGPAAWMVCAYCRYPWREHGCDAHQLAAALAAEQAVRAKEHDENLRFRGALKHIIARWDEVKGSDRANHWRVPFAMAEDAWAALGAEWRAAVDRALAALEDREER